MGINSQLHEDVWEALTSMIIILIAIMIIIMTITIISIIAVVITGLIIVK